MLAVDKAVIIFTVLKSVRDGNLDILSLEMDYRIEAFTVHVVIEKVNQAVA
jgi:hypothetical protein